MDDELNTVLCLRQNSFLNISANKIHAGIYIYVYIFFSWKKYLRIDYHVASSDGESSSPSKILPTFDEHHNISIYLCQDTPP